MQINICQSAYIHLCNISWLHPFLTGSNTAFLARALVTCQITYCNFILSGIRHKLLQTSSCSCSCCVITRTCANILLPSYNNFIGFLYNATLFQDSACLHNLIPHLSLIYIRSHTQFLLLHCSHHLLQNFHPNCFSFLELACTTVTISILPIFKRRFY